MNHYHCAHCQKAFPASALSFSSKGKALACITGLAIGAKTKNLSAAIGLALIGLVIGHLIDEQVSPDCPECGAVLKLLLAHVT